MIALRHRFELSRKTLAVAASALVFLGLLVTVGVGSSSRVCALCHQSQTAGLARSAHASVGCYRCHLSAGAWSYPGFKSQELLRMYPAALLGRKQRGPASLLSSAPCTSCHERAVFSDSPLESGGLRILHRECAADSASCDGCHSTTAHTDLAGNPPGPVMDDCVACHSRKKGPVACETCHEDRLPSERTDTGVFAVTHGPRWRETHGLGNLATCEVCHTAVQCGDCHQTPVPHPADFGRSHGKFAIADRQDCKTCHKRPSFCEDCHAMPMPHPAGFLKEHSSSAVSVRDTKCVLCHEETDCRRCHEKHVHPGGARGVPVPPRIPSRGGGS